MPVLLRSPVPQSSGKHCQITGESIMRVMTNLRALKTAALAATVATGLALGCSTAPKDAGKSAALAANTQAAIASFKAKDPSLQALMDRSVGWAVFPDIGKAGWIVGGSYGRGEVFEAGKKIG